MTKQEIYDELVKRGVSLGPVAPYTKKDLEELLAKTPEKPNPAANAGAGNANGGGTGEKSAEELAAEEAARNAKERADAEAAEKARMEAEAARKSKPLRFDHMGYCAALKRTYYPGTYMPKDDAERDALAPFAVKE